MVKYVYDGWGNHGIEVVDSACETLANLNPFRYRSYYFDTETELYFLKTRYYDPEIGRFMTIDDISYLDPETINGLNLYAYCGNNPVMNIDPTGRFAITSFLIGLGLAALIGAIVGAASYTVGQVINYAQTGQFEWSWGAFIGATLGGAVGGALSYLPGVGPVWGAFISGFITSAGTMLGSNIEGSTNYSFSDIFWDSLIVGGISALSAGIMGRIGISGLNTGRGSFAAIFKQINTKFHRGLINGIKIKTFGKMLVHGFYEGIAGIFLEDTYDETGIRNWFLKWI